MHKYHLTTGDLVETNRGIEMVTMFTNPKLATIDVADLRDCQLFRSRLIVTPEQKKAMKEWHDMVKAQVEKN